MSLLSSEGISRVRFLHQLFFFHFFLFFFEVIVSFTCVFTWWFRSEFEYIPPVCRFLLFFVIHADLETIFTRWMFAMCTLIWYFILLFPDLFHNSLSVQLIIGDCPVFFYERCTHSELVKFTWSVPYNNESLLYELDPLNPEVPREYNPLVSSILINFTSICICFCFRFLLKWWSMVMEV